MSRKKLITAELTELYNSGATVCQEFQDGKNDSFEYKYQSWYTKALRAVQHLASDRLNEFRGYYEIDPKRKSLSYGTYVIQDYLKMLRLAGCNIQNSTLEHKYSNHSLIN
jgi:hypothetical protein